MALWMACFGRDFLHQKARCLKVKLKTCWPCMNFYCRISIVVSPPPLLAIAIAPDPPTASPTAWLCRRGSPTARSKRRAIGPGVAVCREGEFGEFKALWLLAEYSGEVAARQ